MNKQNWALKKAEAVAAKHYGHVEGVTTYEAADLLRWRDAKWRREIKALKKYYKAEAEKVKLYGTGTAVHKAQGLDDLLTAMKGAKS